MERFLSMGQRLLWLGVLWLPSLGFGWSGPTPSSPMLAAELSESPAWDRVDWLPLTTIVMRFRGSDTLVTRTVRLGREIQARQFRFVLQPQRAQISSVTADDELLQDPTDSSRTIFPTASGETETFSRALRITFTREPTEEDYVARLSIYYAR